MERLRTMTSKEVFQVAVAAGIYNSNGELTAPYRDDTSESSAAPRSVRQ